MTTIKIELCSCIPLDLSSLIKENNKKHDIKLYGAFIHSATEFIENNNDVAPFVCVPQSHQEITLSCNYLEILNDNNNNNKKEVKEQKSDNEEIIW